MHPDLSAHLHTDECNAIIKQLQLCHQEHPFKKFMGYCNELDSQMLNCLKREREEKRRKNFENSAAKRMKDANKEKAQATESSK